MTTPAPSPTVAVATPATERKKDERLEEACGQLHAIKAVMLAILHNMRTDAVLRAEVSHSLTALEGVLSGASVSEPYLEGATGVAQAARRALTGKA